MTHVYFDGDKVDWSAYFRKQMIGQGMADGPTSGIISEPKVFRGVRYARGYGSVRNLVGSFGRFLLPIAQNIMESAKTESAKSLGNIASDIAQGQSFAGAIKQRGTEGVKRLGSRLQQCGKGKKRLTAPKVIKPRSNTFSGSVRRANILRNLATMDPDNNPSMLKKVKKKGRKLDYLDFN